MKSPSRVMWNGTVRALPFAEQLRAARIAGCDAISVTPSDYRKWSQKGQGAAEMSSMANDAGVRITHLDPFVRWVDDWTPDLPNFPTDAIDMEADDFFRAADALRVESFTAWAAFPRGRYTQPQLIDAFGALCRRANAEGLRCELEFIPVFGIPDIKAAWEIVGGSGQPSSGIVFDFWHYIRGGRGDALLREIPGDRITAVQICDATAQLPKGMSLVEDGLNNRRAPGDGEFPIGELVDLLKAIGGFNNVGLEVFSSTFDAMTADEIGQKSRAVLDHYLAPPKDLP